MGAMMQQAFYDGATIAFLLFIWFGMLGAVVAWIVGILRP